MIWGCCAQRESRARFDSFGSVTQLREHCETDWWQMIRSAALGSQPNFWKRFADLQMALNPPESGRSGRWMRANWQQ
jgi:hypothetical protein